MSKTEAKSALSGNTNTSEITSKPKSFSTFGRPKKNVSLLIMGIVVVVVIAGGYIFWHTNQSNLKKASAPIKGVVAASTAKENAEYVQSIKNLSNSSETDKSGILRVQVVTFYSQEDYKDTISYAQQLLAIPNQSDEANTLLYMANSYKALGQTDLEKITLQKIVTYYDAHPDEKKNSIYDQVRGRL